MPTGLNHPGNFRDGTPLVAPEPDGTPVTSPRDFGNNVNWTPAPNHFGNQVNWLPSPNHFGNTVDLGTGPFIEYIHPISGPVAGGTSVTITGSGFLSGATVFFGQAQGISVVVVSQNEITVTTPANQNGTPPVNVKVVNTDGQTGQIGNAFTYRG